MFDPDVERLLAAIAFRQAPPLEQLSVAEARLAYQQSCAAFALPAPTLPSVEDLPGPDGCALRIYRPVVGDASLPWLFYLHGGGWVMGGLDTHDAVCRNLAHGSGCCVIAPDYPLAPEHPFPAALDSVLATLAWLRTQADTLRLRPDRMAIGGDSAGANLAASCCLILRDTGLEAPRLQLLFYPATDLRATSDSYARVNSRVPLTGDRMRWFIRHTLRDPADALDWRASPLLAPSLAGLPPCLLVTAGHDPLRDEGIAYAQRLEHEGGRVTLLHLADQIHGFLTLGRALPRAARVLQQAAQELASQLALV
ncbi:alpha/beta hydrolase [Lichenicoccus sp.]|uniref:alpha/beta hydrolase n=1 Tax=Lichenicoccus sp. TaxID=2781899 RepID=UPI003D0C377D